MFQLLLLLFRGVVAAARQRRDVAIENVVLRHQLQVALRTNPNPLLRATDRMLWVWVACLWPSWRRHLVIVRPETVLRWHRKGWRLYWMWRSRTRLGRPRLTAAVRDLIATMTRENRLWGTERVRGELLKLGIVVSSRSIRRYRWRRPSPTGRGAAEVDPYSQSATGPPGCWYLRAVPEVAVLLVRALVAFFRPKRNLVLENMVLRHQHQVALRTNPRPVLHDRDRILWVWVRRVWPGAWRQHLAIVRPETVIGWHRKGWRLYWTWRSQSRLGRPHLSAEVRQLIGEMSRDNPLWGT